MRLSANYALLVVEHANLMIMTMLFVIHVRQDLFFMMTIVFVMRYVNFLVDNVKKANQQVVHHVMEVMFSQIISALLVMTVMILLIVLFVLQALLYLVTEDAIHVIFHLNIVQHAQIKILLNVHHVK